MELNLIGTAILVLASLADAARAAEIAERKTLTLDGAQRAIAAAVAQAHKNHAGGVIAVVDDGGNLMALERVDGTFAAGANISIGKARTAALFQKPTRVFEEIIAKGRTAMVALNDFTLLQGGVPSTIDGQIVGAVGSERCSERSTGRGTGHDRSCRGLWCSISRYLLRQFACERRVRKRRRSIQPR